MFHARLDSGTSLSGDPVDIVLRPAPAAAVKRADLGTYWDEEVVIERVKLGLPGAIRSLNTP